MYPFWIVVASFLMGVNVALVTLSLCAAAAWGDKCAGCGRVA